MWGNTNKYTNRINQFKLFILVKPQDLIEKYYLPKYYLTHDFKKKTRINNLF